MRKDLAKELTLYFDPLYPAKFRSRGGGSVALVGVGGNIGPVSRRFKKLALQLTKHPRVRLVATAPILKNPPFGYVEQPDFLNTLWMVRTTLSPKGLLRFLLWIEKRHGRIRTFKNAPRTLDLDIIFYEDRKIDEERLKIPHPHWAERESVIIPLRYLGE